MPNNDKLTLRSGLRIGTCAQHTLYHLAKAMYSIVHNILDNHSTPGYVQCSYTMAMGIKKKIEISSYIILYVVDHLGTGTCIRDIYLHCYTSVYMLTNHMHY